MKRVMQVLAVFALCTGIANADETGIYLGAGVGKAKVDIPALTEDTDTMFQAQVGYSFNKNLSAEVSYINLGKVYIVNNAIKNTGAAVSLLGILPLQGNTALYGKFGMASIDSESTGSKVSRTDLTWGFGGQLDFSPQSSFRLEFNSYAVGDKKQEHGNCATVSLGLLFRL